MNENEKAEFAAALQKVADFLGSEDGVAFDIRRTVMGAMFALGGECVDEEASIVPVINWLETRGGGYQWAPDNEQRARLCDRAASMLLWMGGYYRRKSD